MDIMLFKNKSDPEYVVKNLEQLSANPIPIAVIESNNIVRPRLKLTPKSRALEANYAYIPTWGRYYNVVPTASQGYIYLDCEVDVLQSWASHFRECTALVVRNQKAYNLYQTDDKMRVENRTVLQRMEFDRGFDKNKQEFLLCVIGNTEKNKS